MKLVRYGPAGAEKPGLIDADGTLRDLSAQVPDIAGAALSDEGLDRLRALDPASLPAVPGTPRLGPPVAGIGKFLCIGLFNIEPIAARLVEDEPVVVGRAGIQIFIVVEVVNVEVHRRNDSKIMALCKNRGVLYGTLCNCFLGHIILRI